MKQINLLENDVPQGYMMDQQGRLVPEHAVREIDKLRDEIVLDIVKRAEFMSGALAEFKAKAMKDVESFAALSAERYNVKLGGQKGNISLTSYDGKYRVVRSINTSIQFDEGLEAARQLLEDCLNKWTEGSSEHLKSAVMYAFTLDRNGMVSTNRVMGLLRLEIDDEDWKTAMRAITESIMRSSSRSYLRVYKRVGATDKYEQINLDIAAV